MEIYSVNNNPAICAAANPDTPKEFAGQQNQKRWLLTMMSQRGGHSYVCEIYELLRLLLIQQLLL